MFSFTFLGTGTSGGIPEIGCKCPVCTSNDPRDKRSRCSAYLDYNGQRILIDAATDLRTQFLQENISRVDSLLFTHAHADHCLGLDDLRAVSYLQGREIDLYAAAEHMAELRTRFNYIFNGPPQSGGGVVRIRPRIISTSPFFLEGLEVTPYPLLHGSLPVTGYSFAEGRLLYITDASDIPEKTWFKFPRPHTLVINALRWKQHSTHFSLPEALQVIERLKPERAYLIHMCHRLGHARDSRYLPDNVFFAYDGLSLEL